MANQEHQPTLRIHPAYLHEHAGYPTGKQAMISHLMQWCSNRGMNLRIDAKADEQNPWELGVGATVDTTLERTRRLAQQLGIEMPMRHTVDSLLKSDEPVIAKDPFAHRGLNKWLLNTYEEKVRFLTWAGMYPYFTNPHLFLHEFVRDVEQVRSRVHKHDFSPSLRSTWSHLPWIFERYIPPTTQFATSFRIVADGFGSIHETIVVIAPEPTNVIQPRDTVFTLPEWEYLTKSPLEIADYFSLLGSPESPLYIPLYRCTSNMHGSHTVWIDGKKNPHPWQREILQSLGMDPDCPVLDPRLRNWASSIGIHSRQEFPFVGVDFILDTSMNYYLLEVNKGPEIDPYSLNLPPETPLETVYETMLTKMLLMNNF